MIKNGTHLQCPLTGLRGFGKDLAPKDFLAYPNCPHYTAKVAKEERGMGCDVDFAHVHVYGWEGGEHTGRAWVMTSCKNSLNPFREV